MCSTDDVCSTYDVCSTHGAHVSGNTIQMMRAHAYQCTVRMTHILT
ncbi:hypothetical protein HMPREF3190_00704 [Umbribacter vaginalis]|nr:hypothetical protein HMPREF3190_00704 [Coriobacteriales bacterium DNF00809]